MSNTTEALNIKKLIQDNNYDEALSETKKALMRDIFPALALKKMTYEYNCLYEKISRLCDFKDNQSAI